MTASREMPKYQCHKKVWALKIKNLSQGVAPTELPGGSWLLHPEDKRYAAIEVSHEWFSKHKPVVGGYYVAYEDGYKSYSPAPAFEAGYLPCNAMTFGLAIEALKKGLRVARAGWNGKGMWLSLSCGPGGDAAAGRREIAFENFWSSNNSEYARQNGGSAVVLPCITMKTATGEILMGWLASQTDMLAEDWAIVE